MSDISSYLVALCLGLIVGYFIVGPIVGLLIIRWLRK